MASSTVPLCPQNKIQRENPGLQKHQKANKPSENLRTQPHITQSSKRGSENQDPNEAAKPTKGVNKLKTISRLPVLAKSLQPVLTDISQSPGLKRWEERPLLGKAQKRKACTKPVPFNLSQSRINSQKHTETAPERAGSSGLPLTTRPTPSKTLTTSQHRTKPPIQNPISSLRNTHVHHTNTVKTNPLNPEAKTSQKPKPNSTQSVIQAVTDSSIQRDLSSQLRSITLAQSELNKDSGHSLRAGGVEERAAFQLKTKGCIQTVLSTKCSSITGNSTGIAVSFSPDPSVLCSILQNEGVKPDGPGATPRASTCPTGRGTSIYSAQRVPFKKHQTEAATREAGPTGNAVLFSPDQSALRTILQNEGVKGLVPVGATPRASTCPSERKMSVYSALRVPLEKKAKADSTAAEAHTGSAVPFSPDPSALRSILLNEGIKAGGPVGTTPQVSTCPSGRQTSMYSAQRVPLKKPQTEAATAQPGPAGSAVQFSPDPSALRSILLNEGIKAGGASGASPRVSTCPSGRGTSIYSAQRVPLKKAKADSTAAEAHAGASRTPNTRRTQQRLPYSQSQSLRRLISARKAALCNPSPGLGEAQSSSTDSSAHQQQEDVVQKLFQEEPEQEENGQMEEQGGEAALGLALEHHHTAELHFHKENKIQTNQPFIQAPQRQSVIVFSSGQRLFGPGTEAQSTEPVQQVQPSGSQSSLNSDTSKRLSPSKQCKTKASNLSSAVCALRRRLPPLEEMFLDEECATYTSCQQAWPTQPRCSNPVASILLFQDSTCFMPVGLGSPSPSPGPRLSSPIR